MSGIDKLFVDPSGVSDDATGFVALLILMCIYGYILFLASNMIADGSELLTLLMSPGLVGGLILPVMGAVPDGAIILFSGLGPKSTAQENVAVGVGTLAGSTIMLLTVPWGLCQLMGRIDLTDKGKAQYDREALKLRNGCSLRKTGVGTTKEVPRNAIIMLGTAITYLIIQGPAFKHDKDNAKTIHHDAAHQEKYWALAGFIIACILFIAYSIYQVFSSAALEQQERRMAQSRKRAFQRDVHVSLGSLFAEKLSEKAQTGRLQEQLLEDDKEAQAYCQRARPILRELFEHSDFDKSGHIDKYELRFLLKDAMRLKDVSSINAEDVDSLFVRFDVDADGAIDFDEFEQMFYVWLQEYSSHEPSERRSADSALQSLNRPAKERKESFEAAKATVVQDEETENNELEEENAHLTRKQILLKALGLMFGGLGMVILFSDPMVSLLSVIGSRMHVPPFYVSFIVTPLVSNASEVISSILFARKRTSASITMTFSALLGAATMNNTFGLSLFLALIYFRGLEWSFTAEVLAILVVEVVMGLLALRTRHPPTWHAIIALLLFPLSIGFVAALENGAGLN
eukprot:gb/GECG01005260.1/.p1 GENE.gb/GECG01005260.1/~~gb/GECG01005260.1/.p1  ORF type:complete len:572 (+),score=71.43 gb/GECG01005260.1/:1-1716(+)